MSLVRRNGVGDALVEVLPAPVGAQDVHAEKLRRDRNEALPFEIRKLKLGKTLDDRQRGGRLRWAGHDICRHDVLRPRLTSVRRAKAIMKPYWNAEVPLSAAYKAQLA